MMAEDGDGLVLSDVLIEVLCGRVKFLKVIRIVNVIIGIVFCGLGFCG